MLCPLPLWTFPISTTSFTSRKEREEEWTVRSEVLLQQYLDEQRKRDEKIKRKAGNNPLLWTTNNAP